MPASPQSTATLMVDKTTAAITAPVTAAAFAAANNLAEAGAPEAHASTHAAAGADPVTLSKSQVGLGNVDNTSDASKPVSTSTQTALDLKAPIASPALTGTPTVPTAAQGTNTTQAASTAFVRAEVAALVDASPGTLDTLNELAAALGDDPDFAATTAAAIALKAPLASPALTGTPTAPTAVVATDNTQIATTAFVHDAIAEIPAGGVTSVDGAIGAVETGYADRITALENVEPTASGSNLVSGGGVSLTGGLTLTVSAAIYNILGVAQSSVETILTAATADPTNKRYDVVALDDTGTAVLITGTPAATPIPPTVDPATQLYLTFIEIPAGATSITGTETIVYDSNDDYTMTEQGTSIVLNSTNNPRGGSGVCIEATTMAATDYFQAQTASGTIDLGTFNVLRFFIRNKAAWHASKQITITARNNGVQVGQAVVFKHGLHAFDQTNVTTYQQISLNPNLFAAGGQAINQIRWTCAGGGSSITGFYVDDIVLQAGVSQATDSTRLRDRGAHSTGLQYDVNDLAYSGSVIYKALQQTPVGVAVTNTTYWSVFGMRNLGGILTTDGANITTPNAMGALAIDVTKGLNTKSISADETFTFSGTPATANTWFSVAIKNTSGVAVNATIPSSKSIVSGSAVTLVVIPAGWIVHLTWRYDGTDYWLYGDPVAGGSSDAEDVAYDNATSGLTATDVQAAIDEVKAEIDAIPPGGGGDLTMIAQGEISGSSAANIDITSIPNTYKSLQLVLSLRGAASATNIQVLVRCNGDTTAANYLLQGSVTQSTGSFPGAAAGTLASIIWGPVCLAPANTGLANSFGQYVVTFADYAHTSKLKYAKALGGYFDATTTGGFGDVTTLGCWQSTSAINQLTILANSGNLAIGSSWCLYGLA